MIDNIWILQSAALTPHFCRDIMRNATHGNVQPPSSNTRFKSNRVVTIYHACFWKLLIKSLLSHECLQGLSYCCTFDCRWPFGSWLYDLLRYFLCSFLVYLNIHIYIYTVFHQSSFENMLSSLLFYLAREPSSTYQRRWADPLGDAVGSTCTALGQDFGGKMFPPVVRSTCTERCGCWRWFCLRGVKVPYLRPLKMTHGQFCTHNFRFRDWGTYGLHNYHLEYLRINIAPETLGLEYQFPFGKAPVLC